MKEIRLADVKIGDMFKVGDIEFIKFKEKDGSTIAVAKNALFRSTFGDTANYNNSVIKQRLERDVLPKIEKAVGAENIIEHDVELMSLDGDIKFGKAKCKISLPTFDFYRANVDIFDKYKGGCWWWLVTPYSTSRHWSDDVVTCVPPRGCIVNYDSFYLNNGVRPFIIFVSSISVISVSCEDD